jgi:hypothetical protein
MIKYNNKKRKMEYGMSFDPDWNQGSTATIVQGQRTDDKVAENLAKTVQVVSAIGGIAGSLKKPGITETSAKKEGGTGTSAIVPNSTASKPEAPEVVATEKEDKDIIGGLKTGFNNFTSKLKDKFPKQDAKPSSTTAEDQPIDLEMEAMSKGLNAKYSNLNWVQRGLNPDNYPTIKNEDGSFSTHKLSYSTGDNGEAYIFPTIIQDEAGNLTELDQDKAFEYARKTNTFMTVPNEKLAEYYSMNGLINHRPTTEPPASIRESKSVEKNPFSLFKKRMRSTASTKTFM